MPPISENEAISLSNWALRKLNANRPRTSDQARKLAEELKSKDMLESARFWEERAWTMHGRECEAFMKTVQTASQRDRLNDPSERRFAIVSHR